MKTLGMMRSPSYTMITVVAVQRQPSVSPASAFASYEDRSAVFSAISEMQRLNVVIN
jgi:hypothetical protein